MENLTPDQFKSWKQNGYLHLKHYFDTKATSQIQDWTEEMASWPETPGRWMKWFESSANDRANRLLCRMEDFLPYHEGYRQLLTDKTLLGMLSDLMGEKAVLFKEKINFKLPGGSGFKAHQDAPAFVTFNQTFHITMMVAIDPATIENGCLEMVPGLHQRGILPQAADGTLDPNFSNTLTWEPVEMDAGDVLFFDSYIPHRSAENRSTRPRRAAYITYNRLSEGECRDDYFRHKREVFPPEIERIPGVKLSDAAKIYNLGNPID